MSERIRTEERSAASGKLSAEYAVMVTEADTAARFGSDFPPAASTPFVLGLAELACHRAVAKELVEGEVTVGTGATIEHLLPSPVGAYLRACARLTSSEGQAWHFVVEVFDEDQLCARLTHDRARVRRARIVERLAERSAQ